MSRCPPTRVVRSALVDPLILVIYCLAHISVCGLELHDHKREIVTSFLGSTGCARGSIMQVRIQESQTCAPKHSRVRFGHGTTSTWLLDALILLLVRIGVQPGRSLSQLFRTKVCRHIHFTSRSERQYSE